MTKAKGIILFTAIALVCYFLLRGREASSPNSPTSSTETLQSASAEEPGTRVVHESEPVSATSRDLKTQAPSPQRYSELLAQAAIEADVCKKNVSLAQGLLSKPGASVSDMAKGLHLLQNTQVIPPHFQEALLAFEQGPTDLDPALLNKMGGCNVVEHYDLLKSALEKSAKLSGNAREQVISATREFLAQGADKPTPLLIHELRVSLLKELLRNGEIEASFESRIIELETLTNDLHAKLVEDVRQCTNPADCSKSYPSEIERSRKLRDLYLPLITQIWRK